MFRLHMLVVSVTVLSLAACVPAAPIGKDDAGIVVVDGGSTDDAGRADAGADGADAGRPDAGVVPPRIDAGPAVDDDGNLTCNGDDACAPNEVCGAVRELTNGNLGIFCRAAPAADAGAVGAACSGGLNFENEGCATAVCDDKKTGACTRVCDDDTDCAADALICTASAVTNVAQRICAKPCERQADCGVGRSCRLREDSVDNANELACAGDLGTKSVGETVAAANECKTALVVVIADKFSCTQPCVTAADCGGAATQCRPVSVPLPDRSANTVVNLCTP